MSKKDKNMNFESWAENVKEFYRKTSLFSKNLGKTENNPYLQRLSIEKARRVFSDYEQLSQAPPDDICRKIDEKCVQYSEEFWLHFTHEATRLGWEIHGTTNRRLINKGVFLSLKGEELLVEEINIRLNPFLPLVIKTVKPLVEGLLPKKLNLNEFLEVIASAYDEVGGPKERSIEDVYRSTVFKLQKPLFWKSGARDRFSPLSRPMFRARLSQMLKIGLKDGSGRILSFGTTVDRRESWEIYSPGEDRIVQVGRISFL